MKLLPLGLLSVLTICAAYAAETRSVVTQPQPRPRLDPARQTAVSTPVPEPATEETKEDSVSMVLDRLVVKDRAVPTGRPPAVEDPVGKFTPLKGGRLLRRDFGGLRIDAGLWPSIELFEDEARFKPTRTQITLDFLRIKW
jgi:hypothetical protein